MGFGKRATGWMSPHDCEQRLKRWLVFGLLHCDIEDPVGSRRKHMFDNKAETFRTVL